jgi:hypothetical protein
MPASRKLYNALAEQISFIFDEVPPCEGMRIMVSRIADVLEEDNSNFDQERFMKACGLSTGGS